MSQKLLTIDQITREALRILHNKLSFVGNINRSFDDSFGVKGAKIGNSLRIRLPNRFVVTDGAEMSDSHEIEEQNTVLAIAKQKHVDVDFTSVEQALSLDDYSKRVLDPAMSQLATTIEADVLANVYPYVSTILGTPGSVPNTLKLFLQAKAKLNQYLAPKDNKRFALIDSEVSTELVDAFKSLPHDSKALDEQFIEGMLARVAGLSFFENEIMPYHTNGTNAGSPVIDGANQTGTSLKVKGFTAGAPITKGTVFEITSGTKVSAINAETRDAYSFNQQFTVLSDVTATDGTCTLSISPAIVPPAAGVKVALQTVSASPDNGATITIKSGAASTAYGQQLVFHSDAFAFVSADLPLPENVSGSRAVMDGISLRILKQYDIKKDREYCRIDSLYGSAAIRPQLAVRITK